MAKIGYGITTAPNFASFMVEFKKKRYQAHNVEVERIMEISEEKRTNEEIEFLTDDVDAKEDKM